MIILFATNDLEKVCTNRSSAVKKYNLVRAKLITRRLDDLLAADNLAVMRTLTGKCHELGEDRKGQLAVHLDGQWRLIFVPANDPLPHKNDGGLDWAQITSVKIIEIGDYH